MESRERQLDPSLIKSVASTVEKVRAGGDEEVYRATSRFDSVELDSLVVGDEEVQNALDQTPSRVLTAIDRAADRIERVNRKLLPLEIDEWQVDEAITVGEKHSPLDSAALWVPCRKAPLASTMLMLGVSARVAGVENIVAATPPRPDGSVDPTTLSAAHRAGVSRVVKGNGVALISALSFGTRSIPRVEAIYGPGPPAIMAALGYVGIYGIRTGPLLGPSECMIVADRSSDPAQAAADLLNECEHGPDSSAVLVTDSRSLASRVKDEIGIMTGELPKPRDEYVSRALSRTGMIVLVEDLDQAADLVNRYAPEHLQISLPDDRCRDFLSRVHNAGEILLGQSTPFSAANYAMGITAVLPTGGSARAYSGITCRDFMKSSTIGRVRPRALPGICDIVSALGEAEGLPAHVQACLRKLGEKPD